jgi:tetratricopeptide (TPR) repeat protein
MRKILLVLLVLGGASASHGQGPVLPDYYFDRSNHALNEQLQSVEKHHLPACIDGAKSRRSQAALDDCDFILRYFPNHPRALVSMAEICLAWGNPRCDPDHYFESAVAVNPNAASTFVAHGIYLLRAKKTKAAIGDLERAVAIDPNSLNAQYNLGLAYLEAKEYVSANEAAQRAYALGAPVPGLRDKLKRAGYWKELEVPKGTPENNVPARAPDAQAIPKPAEASPKN